MPTISTKELSGLAVIDGRKRRQIEIELVSGQLFAVRGDFEMLTTHHESDN